MKPVLVLLACLFCASAVAQPSERGLRREFGPVRESRAEDWRQRRERMQEFRQEMLRQQEAQRPQPRQRFERDPDNTAPLRGLRRLTPEERQRLREEMRDAYRR